MEHIRLEQQNLSDFCQVEVRSDIGGRDSQQDAAWVYTDSEYTLVMVCDGMGGMQDGAKASQSAVNTMSELFRDYLSQDPRESLSEFLMGAMHELDQRVAQALGGEMGGTTAVAAAVHRERIYWFSVGDSRLFILRDGELVLATRDHNYQLRLNSQLSNGEITQEQFDEESEKGEALISYLGMGGIKTYDLTRTPLLARQNDILLLTTDGLYKAIPQELIEYLLQGSGSLAARADQLIGKITVLNESRILDNTTFALIQIN